MEWRNKPQETASGGQKIAAFQTLREDTFVITGASRADGDVCYSFMPLLRSGSRSMLPIRAAIASSC